MIQSLKILMLEDNFWDGEMVERLLKKNFVFNFKVSGNKEAYLQDLEEFRPDIILADNSMPLFTAMEALNIVTQQALNIPFILITSNVSEEFAANIIKQGADDYILKNQLEKLPAVIRAAIKQRKSEKDKIEASRQLMQSEERYRTLVDQAFDGIIIYSPGGAILDCNDSACHYSGYSQSELKALTVTELFFKADLTIRPLNFKLLTTDQPALDYRRLKKKNGGHIEMEIGTKVMTNGNLMAIARDISERKKSEEQLSLFASIINSSEDAIISKKLDGSITSWNEGAAKIFGYTEEEAIGRNVSMLIPSDLNKEEPVILEELKTGEPVQHYETQRIKKDGSRIFISLTTSPVRDNKGIIIGASKIARDISGNKMAEQQKEFDRNNLNALINNTHDLMWSVSRDFKLITFNHAFNEMVRAMTGKVLTKETNILTGFNDEQLQRYKKYYERAFAGETFMATEYTDLAIEYWSEISFYPIYEGDDIIGTACFSHSITKQKKAEIEIKKSHERFEMAASATNDVIWDWDLVSNNLWWNQNYYSNFGYAKKTTDTDVNSWCDRIHPEDKTRVWSGIQADIKNKQHTWTDEYRFLKADGTIAFILDRGYILYNEKGKPIRMVGAMLDISNRKIAEEQLKENLAEKQAAAKRMSTILNTLPANIALLNNKGIIVEINDYWRNFIGDNAFIGSGYGIGDDYTDISNSCFCEGQINGKEVASGITAVLNNEVKEYVLEYSCHLDDLKKWFRMVVTPLQGKKYAGAVVMHLDVSELKKLEKERLQSKIEQQKKITRAMLRAQEKERNNLGRELHDNISQLLAAIKMKLAFCLEHNERGVPMVTECIDHIQEAMNETRNLSHRMVMPRFTESSFHHALHQLTEDYSNQHRLVMLKTTSLKEEMIPAGIKETLYRIAQEQLHNIEKYAKASSVTLNISVDPRHIAMVIEDNGLGFDTSAKRTGIGLTNIMNRAESYDGSATISSKPGQGCRMNIVIPLTSE